MDKLTTITNSGRKKITLCPSSRVLAEGQDKRKKCLQSIEEPNYKLGILFPISYFGKREKGISPAPALFVFSKRARTNNYRTTSSRT
jgi:hypothetical protein|tara:strand:+ start:110 stop:370 length:261 start_codon:yes stop_codon:yes gene_type:complete